MRKTSKKKKIIIGLIYSCIILIASAVIAFASYVYTQEYEETFLCEYSSPDSTYRLEVDEIGVNDEPYGPTNCRFKLFQDNQVVNRFKFIVLNDGNLPTSENFEVEWMDDKVKIKVSAVDQKDKFYYMNYQS